MAKMVITLKIMPESPDTDLDALEKKATELITKFSGEVGKKVVEPVAFGLKSLSLIFVLDENVDSTDPLEAQINELDEVSSVEITDMRRAVG